LATEIYLLHIGFVQKDSKITELKEFNMEKLVKHMYSEMLDADKRAFDIMGVVMCDTNASESTIKEFNDLSVKAITIENLLLDMIDKDKKQEVVDKIMNSKDSLHLHEGCIGIQKEAIVNDDEFQGWDSKVYLYRFNSNTMTDMTPEEFWNIYKEFI